MSIASKGRILFVDEDPAALEDLRRRAGSLGPEWHPEFMDSAAKGLQACAEEPFQVVLAALRMPGMGGAEFLQEVMARFPATIRLLLAGNSDRETALHGLGRVHQFLTKPCDMAYLKSILELTTRRGEQVGNDHVRELVARIGQLPALPELYRKVADMLESDRGSVDQLGEVIGQDIAMTSMILKLSNSAFFSLRHTVTSPTQAVSYLGVDLLKALVLAHGLFGQVGMFRIPNFTIQQLWMHSLAVGAAAKRIAEAERSTHLAGEFFTAGILHDVGILVLASRFPEDYAKVLRTMERAGGDLDAAEAHVFGATHGDVGAYLLALWGLPCPVVLAAAHHHAIHRQPTPGLSAAVAVHVANSIYGGNPDHEAFAKARVDEPYLAHIGLSSRLPVWRNAIQTMA
jgi:HD-like signal output (HDOD) protein